jgi:TRAP-type C4-dicarboxylate transport system permease small subunit
MPTQHLPAPVARFISIITWIENSLLIGLLALMVGLAATQILFRNLLDLSLLEADQLLRMLVLWVALLGAVAASRDRKHISVDVLARFLPARLHAAVRAFTDLFTITVCLVLAWQSVLFVQGERATAELAFGSVPVWVTELILPTAFALIALRYVLHLRHNLRQCFGREECR